MRVLYLEDNVDDQELMRRALNDEGLDCELVAVQSRSTYVKALESDRFDLILADYQIPALDGLEALQMAQRRCPDVPFIFISGILGDERAIGTLKSGATDYVLKDNLQRVAPAMKRAMAEAEERARRQQAEHEVKEYAQRLQTLASKLLAARESARDSIAGKLRHDIAQSLSVLKFSLSNIQHRLGERAADFRVEESIAAVDQMTEAIRVALDDLCTPDLYEQGFTIALRMYAERQAHQAGWQLHFKSNADRLNLPAAQEMGCWTVVREALSNIARHAGARQVTIGLQSDARTCRLQIKDDGRGFDVDAARRGDTMGLLGMEDALRKAEGSLTIAATAGLGTEINAQFPLPVADLPARSQGNP